MREVRRVDARIRPSADAVCDAERDVRALPNSADEERVLAAGGAGAFVFAALPDGVVWVEGEDVRVGVVASVLGGEGCGDAVVYLGARRGFGAQC